MLFKLVFMTLFVMVASDSDYTNFVHKSSDRFARLGAKARRIPLPETEYGEPVLVILSVHIVHFSVDTEKEEVAITMHFRQGWKDPRLAFDSPDPWHYLEVEDPDTIWTPDLYFANEASGPSDSVTLLHRFIRRYPDGKVISTERLAIRTACPMDLRIYPFDTQTCSLKIESYSHTTKDLVTEWNTSTEFPVTGDTSNPEFSSQLRWRTTRFYFRGNEYGTSIIEFNLKRIPTVMIFRVFVPTCTVISFSWASFFFGRRDICIRLLWSLSPVLTYTIQINLGNIFFLHPGYWTGLDIWLSFCFLSMIAAFLESVYVTCYRRNRVEGEADYDFADRVDFRAKIIFAGSFTIFNSFCIIYVQMAQDF